MFCLATLYWDPDPIAFYLPILNHPVLWYSLFFAGGYFLAYLIVSKLFRLYCQDKLVARKFLDIQAWYIFVGMILGARLGHVFFYEWDHYKHDLLKILYTWEGGLASHGGAIGILLALGLFWHRHKGDIPGLPFKRMLDILCVAIATTAGCIRIGNFFNQEILGKATNVPWAVYFGHPVDLHSVQPCHPVQLYEAIFYFATSAALYALYKRLGNYLGLTAGIFFVAIFSFRFFIEWLKLPQAPTDTSGLYMGQLLSLPLVALGIFLILSALQNFRGLNGK